MAKDRSVKVGAVKFKTFRKAAEAFCPKGENIMNFYMTAYMRYKKYGWSASKALRTKVDPDRKNGLKARLSAA